MSERVRNEIPSERAPWTGDRRPRLVKPRKQELADVDLVEAYAAEGGISVSVTVTISS